MSKQKHISGYHSVLSAFTATPKALRAIYLQNKQSDKRSLEIIELAQKNKLPLKYLSRNELDKILPFTNHQGVIAAIEYQDEYDENYLHTIIDKYQEKAFILILDGVQDPHNLGACLRTANAAGVHAVIVPKDKACGLTPTVYKVASGAAGVTPLIQVTNLSRTIELLKKNNIWIYGAAEEADQNIYQTKLTLPLALVFGAEGKGLRQLTKKNCDFLIGIPMYGTVSSLNVSVATGVGLFEVVRQSL